MRAIVFKPVGEFAFATFASLSDSKAMIFAQDLLRAGQYRARVITPDLADAEAVFDYVNLDSKACSSMNSGDVIVWENGKRELCLSIGWADI